MKFTLILVLLLCVFGGAFAAKYPISAGDQMALSSLKNSFVSSSSGTNDLANSIFASWTGLDFCSGQVKYITCSGTNPNRVTQINLVGKGVFGTIPTELGLLTSLSQLYLQSNYVYGSIPTEIGNLQNLTNLAISSNLLTGPLPTELGKLSSLQYLYLFGNEINGTLPTELGNLSNLLILNAYSTSLTGSLPTELGRLSNLSQLLLNNNELIGSIPTELGNLVKLTLVYLNDNQLSGTIPTEIGNVVLASEFRMYSNKLTGTIPSQMANMRSLLTLKVHANQLTGTLPTAIMNMQSLTQIFVCYNNLTGTLPTELGLATKLTQLMVYNNLFTGTVPSQISNLSNLIYFVAKNNRLTGTIPSQIVAMPLQQLYLSLNYLDCPISDYSATPANDFALQRSGCSTFCPPNTCPSSQVCYLSSDDLIALTYNASTCRGSSLSNPCAGNPCNGGVCANTGFGITCDCSAIDFTGNNCQNKIDDCISNTCQNGGKCIDGLRSYTCDCSSINFNGTRCELPINNCNPNHCLNGGQCTNGIRSYTCDCSQTDFNGTNCQTKINDCDSAPCQNGGKCTDGFQSFTCDCSAINFNGTNCEIPIDNCDPSPCFNGGKCINGIRSFTCDCSQVDYNGPLCQTQINNCQLNPCKNGGVCADGIRNYTCDCSKVDYSGTICQTKIDDCASSPCLSGGICIDGLRQFFCTCSNNTINNPCCGTGFKGAGCTIPAITYGSYELSFPVIAYYQFNSGNNKTYDSGPNKYNLDSTTFNSVNFGRCDGPNQALYIDNSQLHLSRPITFGLNDFTVDFIFRATVARAFTIVRFTNNEASATSGVLMIRINTQFRIYVSLSGTTDVVVQSPENAGCWSATNRITVTRSNGQWTLYVNGISVAQSIRSINIPAATMYVGTSLTGYIDELSILSSSLTSTQITYESQLLTYGDSDFCTVNPCLNGGVCSSTPASFTCSCTFNYTGTICDQMISFSPLALQIKADHPISYWPFSSPFPNLPAIGTASFDIALPLTNVSLPGGYGDTGIVIATTNVIKTNTTFDLSSDFSMEIRFARFDGNPTSNFVLFSPNGDFNPGGLALNLSPSGRLYVKTSSTIAILRSVEGQITPNNFFHVIVVKSGNTVSMTLQGETSSYVLNASLFSNCVLYLGELFTGVIDELAFYGYALTPDQIAKHWAAAH